jgi:hypothetical protein
VARVGSRAAGEPSQFRKLEKFPSRASSRAKPSACTCISGPIRIGHNRLKPSACTCDSWCDLRRDRLVSQLEPAHEPAPSQAEPILVARCTGEPSLARAVSPPSCTEPSRVARLGSFPALAYPDETVNAGMTPKHLMANKAEKQNLSHPAATIKRQAGEAPSPAP